MTHRMNRTTKAGTADTVMGQKTDEEHPSLSLERPYPSALAPRYARLTSALLLMSIQAVEGGSFLTGKGEVPYPEPTALSKPTWPVPATMPLDPMTATPLTGERAIA